MQTSKPRYSFVSEKERCRYISGSMCLTVWYDPNGDTLAFELLWGLLVDEWAFRYHRNDGEPRIGRPQKQIMHGNYPLPPDRIKEFLTFDTDIPEDVKEFVLGVLQSFLE
jgi:hypothetical protein